MAAAVALSDPAKHSARTSILKQIKVEVQKLGTVSHDSVLCDSNQALKFFSRERVLLESEHNAPTRMILHKLLIKHPKHNKPPVFLVTSMRVKQ